MDREERQKKKIPNSKAQDEQALALEAQIGNLEGDIRLELEKNRIINTKKEILLNIDD